MKEPTIPLYLQIARGLPEDNLDRRFVEWLYANQNRLEEALSELDIEIKPGWGIYNFRQFKELVKSKM